LTGMSANTAFGIATIGSAWSWGGGCRIQTRRSAGVLCLVLVMFFMRIERLSGMILSRVFMSVLNRKHDFVHGWRYLTAILSWSRNPLRKLPVFESRYQMIHVRHILIYKPNNLNLNPISRCCTEP
jgi:hypothetical protein